MLDGSASRILARVDDAEERKHAQRVRWLARLTWPVLMAGLGLVMTLGLVGWAKAVVLALMLGAVAALNVPSIDVVRRAQREGAPRGAVLALGVSVGLRLIAGVGLALALAS